MTGNCVLVFYSWLGCAIIVYYYKSKTVDCRTSLKICADICYFDVKDYLIVVDYLSKWTEVKKLNDKTSLEVIKKLKDIFATFGILCTIVCDNMPLALDSGILLGIGT